MFFFSCVSDSLTEQAGELNQLPTEFVGDDFAASLFHLVVSSVSHTWPWQLHVQFTHYCTRFVCAHVKLCGRKKR